MGTLLKNLSQGFLDNVNAKIESAVFEMFDFRGKSKQGAVPAAKVTITMPDGGPREEYYTVGKASLWTINADGSEIDGTGSIPARSKLGILISSIMDACDAQGLPTDWITDKITCLVGLDAHWVQVPSGGKSEETGAEKHIPVIDAINALPGGGKAGAPGKDELEADAVAAVTAILQKNNGKVAKSRLTTLLLVELNKNPNKNAISQLAQKDTFLKEWFSFAGGMIALK